MHFQPSTNMLLRCIMLYITRRQLQKKLSLTLSLTRPLMSTTVLPCKTIFVPVILGTRKTALNYKSLTCQNIVNSFFLFLFFFSSYFIWFNFLNKLQSGSTFLTPNKNPKESCLFFLLSLVYILSFKLH